MRRAALNSTRQTILADDLEIAKTGWQRTRGLLGRSPKDFFAGKGLWLLSCEGIHTIGMKFRIDVAYLDGNNRVVRVYHNLKPFRIGRMGWNVKSVLELPSGVLERTHTEVGDLLKFQVS